MRVLEIFFLILAMAVMIWSLRRNKMLKIMNAYTLAFFNRHLKGIDSPLLGGPSSEYPEVILKTKSNGILQ